MADATGSTPSGGEARRRNNSFHVCGWRSAAGSCRWSAAGAALLALWLGGCALWEGPIRTDLEERIREKISALQPAPLDDRSTRPPRSVSDALPEMSRRQRSQILSEQVELGGATTTQRGAAATQPASQPLLPTGPRQFLTVSDARLATLRNNLELQVVLVDPAIARTRITEAEARFDGLIYANVKRQRSDLPPIDDELTPATRPAQQNFIYEYEPGISVPLPSGGSASVSAPLSKKKLDDPKKKGQYLSGLSFSFSQPLLRNAGLDVNLASIRLARYAGGAIDARTQLAAIRILSTAEKAFWRTYGAWKELEIRQQQYDLAYENWEAAQQLVAKGARAEVEALRAQVGVAERLEDLIVAETGLRLRQRELKRLINAPGTDLDSPSLLVTTTEPTLYEFDFNRKQLAAEAIDNRMEMLELELQLAADQVQIDFAKNQTLPLITLDYKYDFLNRGYDFGDAIAENYGFEVGGWSVLLRGEIPITNELRKSQYRRALLNRIQRLSTKAQRTQAIEQEVFDVLDTLRQNWQRILANRQNVILAGVNYEAELKQFDLGLRTQIEVLEALTRLGTAQVREIRAIVDYQISQIDLAFATGTLLGYSRVGLEAIDIPAQYHPVPTP